MPEPEQRPYPSPSDLAAGRSPQPDWRPDGVILRGGTAHEVSVVREEGDEYLVSGLTFMGWVPKAWLIRPE